MKIIDELKAAHAAVGDEEWRCVRANVSSPTLQQRNPALHSYKPVWIEPIHLSVGNDERSWPLADLIALMKNNLPALIECVGALEDLIEYAAVYANPEEIGVDPERLDAARTALAKLKGVRACK